MVQISLQKSSDTSIDWEASPHLTYWIKRKLENRNWLPEKGISKYVFSAGPWKPFGFELKNKEHAPEEIEYRFFNYEM